jgi:hypothetical protein
MSEEAHSKTIRYRAMAMEHGYVWQHVKVNQAKTKKQKRKGENNNNNNNNNRSTIFIERYNNISF